MKPEPLPPLPADRRILAPVPDPGRGVVSWNMNTSCNYRCSYCTQRFLDDRGRWVKAAFKASDGSTIEYILQE